MPIFSYFCRTTDEKLYKSIMNRHLRMIFGLLLLAATGLQAQVTPVSQMEKLDRGLVVVASSSIQNFVSWRLLGTDDKANTTFDVLCDGAAVASGLTKTNYRHSGSHKTSKYQVVVRKNGEIVETTPEVMPWSDKYLSLQLQRPEGGVHAKWRMTADGKTYADQTNYEYTYTPNDMSVGDVDGDGQYELFVKWDPSTSQDNSYNCGYSGSTYIDCYKVHYDGSTETVDDQQVNCKLLWRIDLGQNIRSGAHYTHFMVYDFDGDGRAEMMCKTATGSKDGQGNYVNQAATDATIKGHANNKDYRNSNGHILDGPEYLTVFDGLTGKAIHTTWYLPGRAGTGEKTPSGSSAVEGGNELGKVSSYPSSSNFWGDSYGGRSERFLAGVAYVNGADKPACGIFTRGYYTRAYIWAVSFDGTRLHTEWLHASPNATQWLVYATKWADGQAGVEINVDGDVLKRIPIKVAAANTSGVKSTDSSGGIAGSNTMYGNGNHNLSIADVDGDGCDEIVWGAATLDNDGSMLYATGYGHGDAIHVGKMVPDDDDFYVFDIHEEKLTAAHGSWDLHNARTGEIRYHGGPAESDNGRGMAADLTGKDGWEFWSTDERNPKSAKTGSVAISKSCTVNFRIYWDGSIQDQLFDGGYSYDKTIGAGLDPNASASPSITKWNGSSFTTLVSFNAAGYGYGQTCNTTKATPCLQADIFGDWREELILWNKEDPSKINIYSTATPTDYAVPCLMHDHTYRMGICWQNTGYNQPPHLGYYLPDYIAGKLDTGIRGIREDRRVGAIDDSWYTLDGRKLGGEPSAKGVYVRGGKKVVVK